MSARERLRNRSAEEPWTAADFKNVIGGREFEPIHDAPGRHHQIAQGAQEPTCVFDRVHTLARKSSPGGRALDVGLRTARPLHIRLSLMRRRPASNGANTGFFSPLRPALAR